MDSKDEMPLAGECKAEAVIESSRGVLIGGGAVKLEDSLEKVLLDYAWIGLPLLSNSHMRSS